MHDIPLSYSSSTRPIWPSMYEAVNYLVNNYCWKNNLFVNGEVNSQFVSFKCHVTYPMNNFQRQEFYLLLYYPSCFNPIINSYTYSWRPVLYQTGVGTTTRCSEIILQPHHNNLFLFVIHLSHQLRIVNIIINYP